MRRGDYGYDAPFALVVFAALALVSAIAAVVAWAEGPDRTAALTAFYFLFFLANASSFFYTTRRGKFIEWKRILDGLRLRGDESVLDMGCGRGAVLTAAATRLKTGRATGIDIWSRTDQSGNTAAVTRRNASLEGVADRVRIVTGDMRALPFQDGVFDLVLSSLAIHNIRTKADRRRAVAEAFRVVKPGGTVVIADIRAAAVYEHALLALGAVGVERHRLGWRFWWGNPFAATSLVRASKAAVS
jgi:SAM-dependent methyltransferase